MQERKPRKRYNVDVSIGPLVKAEGLDISEHGMYIFSRHTYAEGTMVELSFRISERTYDLTAKVAHAQPGVGFGVNFIDRDIEVAEELKRLIEGLGPF